MLLLAKPKQLSGLCGTETWVWLWKGQFSSSELSFNPNFQCAWGQHGPSIAWLHTPNTARAFRTKRQGREEEKALFGCSLSASNLAVDFLGRNAVVSNVLSDQTSLITFIQVGGATSLIPISQWYMSCSCPRVKQQFSSWLGFQGARNAAVWLPELMSYYWDSTNNSWDILAHFWRVLFMRAP